MHDVDHVVVRIASHRLAIPTEHVQELMFLPAMADIAEAPPAVIGLAEIRGHATPIVDGHRLLHMPHATARLSDVLVIVEAGGVRAAIRVDAVLDVVNVAQAEIDPVPDWPAPPGRTWRHVEAYARKTKEILLVLDVATVLHEETIGDLGHVVDAAQSATGEDAGHDPAQAQPSPAGFSDPDLPPCLSHFDEASRALLNERADAARSIPSVDERSGASEHIEIVLNDERFVVAARHLKEILTIDALVRLPGAPDHISGIMNHGGDFLSVVDLGRLFGTRKATDGAPRFVAVVGSDGRPMAFAVDGIGRMIMLGDYDVGPALDVDGIDDGWVLGSVMVDGRMVPLIHLGRVARSPGLVVDQAAAPTTEAVS